MYMPNQAHNAKWIGIFVFLLLVSLVCPNQGEGIKWFFLSPPSRTAFEENSRISNKPPEDLDEWIQLLTSDDENERWTTMYIIGVLVQEDTERARKVINRLGVVLGEALGRESDYRIEGVVGAIATIMSRNKTVQKKGFKLLISILERANKLDQINVNIIAPVANVIMRTISRSSVLMKLGLESFLSILEDGGNVDIQTITYEMIEAIVGVYPERAISAFGHLSRTNPRLVERFFDDQYRPRQLGNVGGAVPTDSTLTNLSMGEWRVGDENSGGRMTLEELEAELNQYRLEESL